MVLQSDINFVQRCLPDHYKVKQDNDRISCISNIGIVEGKDGEDDEHWHYILLAFKKYFGKRFKMVDHNTCFCHINFNIIMNQDIIVGNIIAEGAGI